MEHSKYATERSFPKPANDKIYEVGWKSILEVAFNCDDARVHGRNGQGQYGLDVTGFQKTDTGRVEIGIQCKWKGPIEKLTKAEVREEIGKLLKRPSTLPKKYYVVATSPNDVNIKEEEESLQKLFTDAGLSSPLFMYQFDLESLARAGAYLGTDVA
jgi:hypothetical protein